MTRGKERGRGTFAALLSPWAADLSAQAVQGLRAQQVHSRAEAVSLAYCSEIIT